MPNFFKKISSGANNFFKKIEKGGDKFFMKTIPNVSKKIGSGFEMVGDKIAGAGKQVGNFLEKNSAILGDVAGGVALASGFGAPVGAALIAGGNVGQQFGQNLKRGSSVIQQAANRTGNLIQNKANLLSNQANQQFNKANQQFKQNVGMATSAINNAVNNAKSQAVIGLGNLSNQIDNVSFH